MTVLIASIQTYMRQQYYLNMALEHQVTSPVLDLVALVLVKAVQQTVPSQLLMTSLLVHLKYLKLVLDEVRLVLTLISNIQTLMSATKTY